MSASKAFVARLVGSAVFDPHGDRVGRLRDVLVVRRPSGAPRAVGLVVEVPGRRRVFLSIGRVTAIHSGQVIVTGLINLRRFQQRPEELRIAGELLGARVDLGTDGTAQIDDVSITQTPLGDWEIADVSLRRLGRGLDFRNRRSQRLTLPWDEVLGVAEAVAPEDPLASVVESLSQLSGPDLAGALLDLPAANLVDVAKSLPNDRLADALEEMTEEDQADLIARLDDERAADVLDEMQPDDAADLIAHLPTDRGEALLDLMEPDEAEDVRFLLAYAPDTAGGLMTTAPIIVSADATVAEGLALIRRHETAPTIAAAVCVTLPPYEAPTGRYLGMVHFQRMLRYPPHERLGALVDEVTEPLNVTDSAATVARALARDNLVSVPVVDEFRRLVGVVTVDDVLDRLLPDDWRASVSSSRVAEGVTGPVTTVRGVRGGRA